MAETKRAIALGFFDGVHLGHAALLNMTRLRAGERGYIPSVLSFDTHPDQLVRGGAIQLINTVSDRKGIIKRLFGIGDIILLHFDLPTMRMPWQDFASVMIDSLNIGWIVVGHDFSFGHKGEGTAEKLREYCAYRGIGCDIIPAVALDGVTVSSTHIRTLISSGELDTANRFLGHPHILTNPVENGHHLGTKLGTPTVNQSLPPNIVVPRKGVYATLTYTPQPHISVTNVGTRPTTGDNNEINIETHLINYSADLYGQLIRVEFHKFLRPERKFLNYEALSAQIRQDACSAYSYLKENSGC